MLDAPKIELRRTLHTRDRKIIAVPLTVRYHNTRTNPTRSERGTCKLLQLLLLSSERSGRCFSQTFNELCCAEEYPVRVETRPQFDCSVVFLVCLILY